MAKLKNLSFVTINKTGINESCWYALARLFWWNFKMFSFCFFRFCDSIPPVSFINLVFSLIILNDQLGFMCNFSKNCLGIGGKKNVVRSLQRFKSVGMISFLTHLVILTFMFRMYFVWASVDNLENIYKIILNGMPKRFFLYKF